jgi:hypothetical protein
MTSKVASCPGALAGLISLNLAMLVFGVYLLAAAQAARAG